MVTKGFITGIPNPTDKITSIKYKVDIYIFKSVGDKNSTRTTNSIESTVAYTPGNNITYNIGDCVFVDFEDNEYGHPVIIGKLLTKEDELFNAKKEIKNLQGQIDELKATITNLNSFFLNQTATSNTDKSSNN